MKVCILIEHENLVRHGLAVQPDTIATTAEVYAYNLGRELLRRGVEVVYGDPGKSKYHVNFASMSDAEVAAYYESLRIPPADHLICVEQALSHHRDPRLVDFLRTKISGVVATICDHDGYVVNEDVVFTARIPSQRSGKAVYVGWAADPTLFYAEKSAGIAEIFVDHLAAVDPASDRTDSILNSCREFIGSRSSFRERFGQDIEVCFFGPSGLEKLRIDDGEILNWDEEQRRRLLKEYKRVPQKELAAAVRRADIFVATHSESMGLPILEAALSGCLVVAHRSFIRPELIRPLHHILWDTTVPWAEAMGKRDVELASRLAAEFSWSVITDRILETFSDANARRAYTAALENPDTDRKVVLVGSAVLGVPPLSVENIRLDAEKWSRTSCILAPSTADGPVAGRRHEVFAMRGLPEDRYHYINRNIEKLPRPTEFSFGICLHPGVLERAGLWLSEGTQRQRVQAEFLLRGEGQVVNVSTIGEWQALDVQMVRLGDWYWCGMSVVTDWGPRLRILLFSLADDGSYTYCPLGDGTHDDLYVSAPSLQFGRWPLIML